MSLEILAPGGSKEAIFAGLYSGADAVYTGTSRFSARAFADNPTVEELCEIVDFAHLHGKKIYLTVNTLLTDEELEDGLYPMLSPLYQAGLDAVIVQDYGVLHYIHENFPKMDIHASTQMTLLTGDSANLLKPYGVTRIVPARELSIQEIELMRNTTDLELEVFVHGALCYCYSGQCLMSQVIGGRSGNRGMCAQPCRFQFEVDGENTAYYLSTKDMCTLDHVGDMIHAGVDSFKIEGRMKKPAYTAYTASLYRAYADAYLSGVSLQNKEVVKDIERLADIYNRGGFCQGYLFEKEKKNIVYTKKNSHFGVCVGEIKRVDKGTAEFKLSRDISYQDVLEFRNSKDEKVYEYTVKDGAKAPQNVSARYQKGCAVSVGQKVYRTKNNSLLDQINQMVEDEKKAFKCMVKGEFTGKCGENITLSIDYNGLACSVTGVCAEQAKGKPVTAEEIEKRLRKTGESQFDFEQLEVNIEDNLFLPLGKIAALRRDAFDQMEQLILKRFHRETCNKIDKLPQVSFDSPDTTIIQVTDFRQIHAVKCMSKDVLNHVSLNFKLDEFDSNQWEELVHMSEGISYYISLPTILRPKNTKAFLSLFAKYRNLFLEGDFKGIIVDSLEALPVIQKMNISNIQLIAGSRMYLWNNRTKHMYKQLGLCGHISNVYGRTAVMVTEGCVQKELGQCTKEGSSRQLHCIRTPKNDEFLVENVCRYCYNVIYEKDAGWHEKGDITDVSQICFTFEGEEEVRKVLSQWNFL